MKTSEKSAADNKAKRNQYYFDKDLYKEFPELKWILILAGIVLIIYLSKFIFNAIAGSVESFKNLRDACRK